MLMGYDTGSIAARPPQMALQAFMIIARRSQKDGKTTSPVFFVTAAQNLLLFAEASLGMDHNWYGGVIFF
jgi:nitroreductase